MGNSTSKEIHSQCERCGNQHYRETQPCVVCVNQNAPKYAADSDDDYEEIGSEITRATSKLLHILKSRINMRLTSKVNYFSRKLQQPTKSHVPNDPLPASVTENQHSTVVNRINDMAFSNNVDKHRGDPSSKITDWCCGYPIVIQLFNEKIISLSMSGACDIKIYDDGCGSAEFTKHLHDIYGKITVIGGDPEQKLITKGKQMFPEFKDNLIVIEKSKKLPFDDEYFDMICSNFVIQTFSTNKSLETKLTKLNRVLKKGGTLVMSINNPEQVNGVRFSSIKVQSLPQQQYDKIVKVNVQIYGGVQETEPYIEVNEYRRSIPVIEQCCKSAFPDSKIRIVKATYQNIFDKHMLNIGIKPEDIREERNQPPFVHIVIEKPNK